MKYSLSVRARLVNVTRETSWDVQARLFWEFLHEDAAVEDSAYQQVPQLRRATQRSRATYRLDGMRRIVSTIENSTSHKGGGLYFL